MPDKFVCTFSDEKQHTADYVSNLSAIKLMKNAGIILLPLWCAMLIYSICNKNIYTIIFSAFFVILVLMMIFYYPVFMRKALEKETKLRYGDGPIEQSVIFDDKIYITVKENRAVLEYDKIKKIVDCGSIYALLYSKTGGTYFAKNSCPDADDNQILAFLQGQTGAKLVTKHSKGSVVTTIILTVLSFLLSLTLVLTTVITAHHYTKRGIDLLDDPTYVTLDDTGLDYTVDYEDVYYQIHVSDDLFYDAGSVMIFDYTDENYNKEVKFIEENMQFLDKPIYDDYDCVLPEAEFSISDWDFKVCSDDDYAYPKYFRIMGFNENQKQVAFLDFDGPDLDIAGDTMTEFIDDYFDYDFS